MIRTRISLIINGFVALTIYFSSTGFVTAEDFVPEEKTYFAMKRAFIKHPNNKQRMSKPYDGTLALYNCVSSKTYHYGTIENSLLSELAFDVVYLQETVKHAGYDEKLWNPILIEYERKALQRALSGKLETWKKYDQLRDKTGNQLARILNSHGKKTYNVYYQSECGAGEIEIEARVEPQNASISIIPLWNWYVCSELGIKPYDTEKCPGWITFTNHTKLYVAGDYRYLGKWPNGSVTMNSLKIREDIEAPTQIIFTENGPYLSTQ